MGKAQAVSSRRTVGHIFLNCLWREDHELKTGSPLNRVVLKLCYGKQLQELRMVRWWVGNIVRAPHLGLGLLSRYLELWQLILEVAVGFGVH